MQTDYAAALSEPFDRSRGPLGLTQADALAFRDRRDARRHIPAPAPPGGFGGGVRGRVLAVLFDPTVVAILWASVAIGLLTPRVADLLRYLAR